ncbi:fungal specific transcription factor domain-containing protein [Aspergillus fijiensis CBS 313.89]|uniref:Xylanolytic transcriptional activator regulatory domain-containing protein n=1 Tax=Aspergillus fijiensis CBS 313.89 TaxID=1448319 RepID=A0A8G1VYT8_9EURO|nr:uncharacterized protein BO72DRAFT_495609 [Aspergillus fijiensis CBS 313.89]RAK78075.1 hypothetical protein BO72DRAFT_495609 [Aspergillus fijiensis CBS 313.89]
MDKLSTLELPWARVGPVRDSSAVPKLPARPMVERSVASYCSSYQSLVFPVISKSLFAKTLHLAYGPHCYGSDSAKSCIYALLSVVAIFGLENDLGDALDCEAYAIASQSFTVPIINEMTMDGLQALVMLTQHHYFLADLQSAAVSMSMASRLVFKLGAHARPGPTIYHKSIPECHLRDLFWLCYSFDQDLCLTTGQPPSESGVFCSLDLPTHYAQLQDTNLQHPEQTLAITDATLPLYPWDLRLSPLKAEIYEALYSATACQRSNSEFFAQIHRLDQALEHWRLSLAPDIRPTLQFSVGMPVDATHNTQAVMLRRTRGWGERVVMFYAITSILTLFRNILRNPRDPAMADLADVLQGVPNLIGKIPIRTLTVGPMIHLRFLNNFATEPARLARCAMAKAEREVAASDEHSLP